MTEFEINAKEYAVQYDLDNRMNKVDVDGSDVEFRYDATGRVQNESQINNSILWNTRRLDPVSGFYLYKYRHYSAELGRWPSRDPIEEDGGINLYGFVGNDGINNWDELGRSPGQLHDDLDEAINSAALHIAVQTALSRINGYSEWLPISDATRSGPIFGPNHSGFIDGFEEHWVVFEVENGIRVFEICDDSESSYENHKVVARLHTHNIGYQLGTSFGSSGQYSVNDRGASLDDKANADPSALNYVVLEGGELRDYN